MSTTVTYKNSILATVSGNTKTLKTSGKYMEADVILTDDSVDGDNLAYGNLEGLMVGVQIDYENNTITRLGAAEGLTWGSDFDQFEMFGGRRRVNLAANGTVLAEYGDAAYSETGWTGATRTSVMVEQPKFYYKVEPLKLDGMQLLKANYYVLPMQTTGFKLHPAFINENGDEVDYYYIGAYEASLYDVSEGDYDLTAAATKDYNADCYGSIANALPIVSFTRPNGTKMAKNNGSGWYSLPFAVASAEQLLMTIELAGNFQTVLGAGVTGGTNSKRVYTGATSTLGNASGVATEVTNADGTTYTGASQLSVSYRGCENPWGNIYKWVDGLTVWGDGSMGGGQAYIGSGFSPVESTLDGYSSMGFNLPGSGNVKYFGYVADYDYAFVPITIGGTSWSFTYDYLYTTSNLSGYRAARLGGTYSNGSGAGGFRWALPYAPNSSGSDCGGRLVYVYV